MKFFVVISLVCMVSAYRGGGGDGTLVFGGRRSYGGGAQAAIAGSTRSRGGGGGGGASYGGTSFGSSGLSGYGAGGYGGGAVQQATALGQARPITLQVQAIPVQIGGGAYGGAGGASYGGASASGRSASAASSPIYAAIQSTRSLDVVDVASSGSPASPQSIVIGPSVQPIDIEFQSQSSPVSVRQTHIPGKAAAPQVARHEEEPDLLKQEIVKPVIHEVTEAIQPYRRITQEVRPVLETINQIISRGQQQQSASAGGAAGGAAAQSAGGYGGEAGGASGAQQGGQVGLALVGIGGFGSSGLSAGYGGANGAQSGGYSSGGRAAGGSSGSSAGETFYRLDIQNLNGGTAGFKANNY